MVRRKLKKTCIIITLICTVVSIASLNSSAVDPLTFSAMSAAADAFGMSYGIGTTYSVTNAAGVNTSFQDLWDDFKSYQSNQGDSYNYQDYYDNFNDKNVIQSFSHSSGKFSGFHLDSEDVTIFSKFWNWLLTGPAEMVKVDNQYKWNTDQDGIVNPIVVGDYQTYFIDGNRVTYIRNSLSWANNAGNVWTITVPYPSFGYLYDYGTGVQITLLSTIEGGTASIEFPYDDRFNHSEKFNNQVSPGWYQAWPLKSFDYGGVVETIMPKYSNFIRPNGPINTSVTSSGDTISVEPYNNLPITIPDPSDQGYVPKAIDIVTNIPWDDSYNQEEDQNGNPIPLPATDVPNIVNDWLDSIQDNTYDIEDLENEDPQPPANEVYIPFLPVTLPSFNFSFSGIWHYVREWVTSLESFFTTLFSIWSALPYAMVVPVYATAVVVIVLGVYKRFFM